MIRSRGQSDVRFGMFVLCISTACAQLQAHIPNQRQSNMNATTPIEKLETYVLRPGAFDDLNIPRDSTVRASRNLSGTVFLPRFPSNRSSAWKMW